jgi:hypothetical protein
MIPTKNPDFTDADRLVDAIDEQFASLSDEQVLAETRDLYSADEIEHVKHLLGIRPAGRLSFETEKGNAFWTKLRGLDWSILPSVVEAAFARVRPSLAVAGVVGLLFASGASAIMLTRSGRDGVVASADRTLSFLQGGSSAHAYQSSPETTVTWMELGSEGAKVTILDDDLVRIIREAASRGDSAALVRMGYFNEQGVAGFKRDKAKAIEYYQRAVAKQNVDAMIRLAGILENEPHPDSRKVRRLYELAASKGNPIAKSRLDHRPVTAPVPLVRPVGATDR